MPANLRKRVFVLSVIGVMVMSGCGKAQPETVYGGVLSALTQGQSFAFAEVGEGKQPVLLVTDGVYTYEEGVEASFMCEAYQVWDGTVYPLGNLESSGTVGTAYPVRYNKEGIYVAGLHSVEKYCIDEENRQLTLAQYARETFDESGNAAYTDSEHEKDGQATDASFLNQMREDYEKADVVNFKNTPDGN